MLRATLKSLLSRKVRLVLSGLAVVLGVMFVSGAFVLTDTLGRSFTDLFQNAYANVDVQVSPAPKLQGQEGGGRAQGLSLPASVRTQVEGMPGVASAVGRVGVPGAQVVGKDGKVLTSFGPPQLGVDWPGMSGNGNVVLRQGTGPQSDGQVTINGALASTAGLHVGDPVDIITPTVSKKQAFTVVGIFGYSGGRDSLGGEQTVAFTLNQAQRLMLGGPDLFSSITVRKSGGITDAALRDRIKSQLGPDYVVQTGKELADATAKDIQTGLSFFNNVLLGFAGVALFVGIFLILNTFSIIVAQRTRELALMRAMGASKRQMVGSVMLEAFIIGLIASALGLLAGIGVGFALAWVFGHIGGSNLQLAGVGVPAAAVIGAFGVGITITLVAALMPALRAARVAPVAAMREAATADRPLTRISIIGGVVTAVGASLLALGLSGKAHSSTLAAILGGVLVSFIGVALLTPLLSKPVVSVLGRLFAWSVPGQLGRRNSARNPRRTAITAAALMVGIALITGVNVILSSATTSITKLADKQVHADLIVSGQQSSQFPPTFDHEVLPKIQAIPGVAQVIGFYGDAAAVDGKLTGLTAVDNPPALHDIFGLTAASGTIDRIEPGQLLLDEKSAQDRGLHVGSQVKIQMQRGALRTFTLTGIYAKNDLANGWLLSSADATGFRSAQPSDAFIRLAPGASVATVKSQVETLLADNPQVSVTDRSQFVKQQTSGFDTILTMIQILLALAILIAVLGIVNTLALSVLERTRELGLLRAIGLRRWQAMRMVTVEAVVISVFGALLGLAVGCGLGAAVVRALRDDGFTDLAFPWSQMVVYLVLAGFVGVFAAILPAIRAARINVLAAIAYE
jgi:putative ABC transport system permease protein